jgi:hypothetical protein
VADPPRSAAQRKADTLAKLEAPHADVWVATASSESEAHLVPLTLAWDGTRVIIAVEEGHATPRNIVATRRARLALGPTRDVVMIDATLERDVPVEQASQEIAERYAAQGDWDPRTARGGFLFLLLRPHRIQAWREANEIKGRTLMRDGAWLV